MGGLLALAADGHEAQLVHGLEQLVELDQLPDLNALTWLLGPPKWSAPQVVVTFPMLESYDELLAVAPLVRVNYNVGNDNNPTGNTPSRGNTAVRMERGNHEAHPSEKGMTRCLEHLK